MIKKNYIYVSIFYIICIIIFLYSINNIIYLADSDWIGLYDINFLEIIFFSIILNIVGHLLRAYNSWTVLKPIRFYKYKFSVFFLGIGYIFNLLFPFRIGEIVRIFLIAKFLKISRVATFFSVFFERSVDLLFISITSLIFIVIFLINNSINIINVYTITLSIIIFFTCINLLIIFLLKYENRLIIKAVYKISSIFNSTTKNNIRYTVWALITWLNYIFTLKKLIKYFIVFLGMWSAYILSVYNILTYVSDANIVPDIIVSLNSYSPLLMPSIDGFFISFQNYFYSQIKLYNVKIYPEMLFEVSLIIWIVLTLPIVIVSFVWYLIGGKRIFADNLHSLEQHNRLWRESEHTHNLNTFLESYFLGNEIFHLIRNFEAKEKIKLLDFFRGGSNASTFLCESNKGQLFVRKCTIVKNEKKLIDQYNWLNYFNGLKNIPRVFNINSNKKITWYDLDFKKGEISLFKFIQSNPIDKSSAIIIKIIDFMQDNIYRNKIEVANKINIKNYIKDKCFLKLEEFSKNIENKKFLDYEYIYINGVKYSSLLNLLNRILDDDNIISKLANYDECFVHGDLTLENILVSDKNFTLIDPNNENLVSTPAIDYAKLYQSLHMGYEFLCDLKYIEITNDEIRYADLLSYKHKEIYNTLSEHLSKLLKNDYASIYFHEGVHFCRLLPYRGKLNANTSLVFYAAAIQCFSKFLECLKN